MGGGTKVPSLTTSYKMEQLLHPAEYSSECSLQHCRGVFKEGIVTRLNSHVCSSSTTRLKSSFCSFFMVKYLVVPLIPEQPMAEMAFGL